MTEQYVITPEELRRESLRNALQHHSRFTETNAEQVLETANKFHAFVTGASAPAPAPAPRNRARKAAAADTSAAPAVQADASASTESAAAEPDVEAGFLDEVLGEEPKKEEPPKVVPPKIEDVRAALLDLQKRATAKIALSVLAKAADGADTLGKIKTEKYQAVIDAAKNWKAA